MTKEERVDANQGASLALWVGVTSISFSIGIGWGLAWGLGVFGGVYLGVALWWVLLGL
jgi:hypothetical protein